MSLSSPYQHTFGLQLVTKIGLAISLLCLVLCILTFKFCRSIQGTRTTIHLHLCICLFFADLFFLAGISQTSPVVRLARLATIFSVFGTEPSKRSKFLMGLMKTLLPNRVAAGSSPPCSISSSWASSRGCFWKGCSSTVWWFRSSTPQSGPSTCL